MAAGARAHSPCQTLGPDTAWVTPRMETLAGRQGHGKREALQFLEGPWKVLEELPSSEGSGGGPPPPRTPHPHAQFEDIPLSGFLWKR